LCIPIFITIREVSIRWGLEEIASLPSSNANIAERSMEKRLIAGMMNE